MTGSVAIDVALGLCFIFLLYSLLATIIQEMVSRWLGLRARMLLKAVARMLDDQEEGKFVGRFLEYFYDIYKDARFYFVNSFENRPISEKFYTHPTIKYLGESSWNRKPSYLSDKIFSQTLVDILRGEDYDGTQNQMDLIKERLAKNVLNFKDKCDTVRQMKIFVAEAKGDVDKFKALIETWYNETMERCSGWFKRQAQFIAFFIGLGLALTFNIDTISIVDILSTDTKAPRTNGDTRFV